MKKIQSLQAIYDENSMITYYKDDKKENSVENTENVKENNAENNAKGKEC